MSFSSSSRDIRIELESGQPILYATVEDGDGEWNDTSINLDEAIGNDDGWFSCKVNAFSQSAEAIDLDFRDDGPWLVAQLSCADGSYRELQGINLDLHIENINGELVWVVSNSNTLVTRELLLQVINHYRDKKPAPGIPGQNRVFLSPWSQFWNSLLCRNHIPVPSSRRRKKSNCC